MTAAVVVIAVALSSFAGLAAAAPAGEAPHHVPADCHHMADMTHADVAEHQDDVADHAPSCPLKSKCCVGVWPIGPSISAPIAFVAPRAPEVADGVASAPRRNIERPPKRT